MAVNGKIDSEILTILHYNDVYNIDANSTKEPIGGAARFCTALKTFDYLNPLILFSGDIFSPSMLSTFTQGEQMIPVLNATGTHCAVFGNHDFDHGLDVLMKLIKDTTFPWLMSNVIDDETGHQLGGGKIKHIIKHQSGFKVGLIGLVEKEWLETLPTIDPKGVTFIDYTEAGNQLSHELKNDDNCDIVIALTHMRTPNDINLAKNCPGIDLILGGHDHVFEIQEVNGIKIIKSGTDFRQFSKISIKKARIDGKLDVTVDEIDVTSAFAEDQILKEALTKYTEVIAEKMTEVLGNFTVELDGRFSKIRTEETNLGDWVCDVVLAATGAEVVMINSGTFRSDQVHSTGPFLMKDLVNIIPMRDPLILIEISGECLLAALENSVSAYPKLEGRFPQVSGISFAFDPSKPPGSRVDTRLVFIADEHINLKQNYKICVKSYMHGGCDGYSMFGNAKILLDDDSSPELGLAIQNHFKAIDMKMCNDSTKHRQSLVTISRRSSMVQMLEDCDLDGPSPIKKLSQWKSFDHGCGCNGTEKEKMLTRRASIQEFEEVSCQLAPKTQQRIIRILDEEHLKELLLKARTLYIEPIIEEANDE